jgi:hypothetical protein
VAAKHFFKYVRPGSVRVAATPSDPSGVYASAYLNDGAKTLTSVLVNAGGTSQTVNLKLSNVAVTGFSVNRRSAAGSLWADGGAVSVNNGTATITLAPQSVVTLQGSTNVQPPPPPAGVLSGAVIGTAGAHSSNPTATRDKAFDGNLSTFFDAPTANGAWVGLDLGTAKAVTQVKFAPRASLANRMVGGKFQGSNDPSFASGVADLYTVTVAPPVGTLTSAAVANASAFRYVRYLSPANSYGNVAEVQFVGGGTANPGPTTPINRAAGGTAAASSTPVSHEGPAKAFDGSTGTKWYGQFPSGGSAWLQYQFGSGQAWAVTQYKLTSANDAPARDPRDWRLLASDDGVNWTPLDTRTNQTFASRYQTNTYSVSNTTAYKFYRLHVTATAAAAGYVQLSELQLLA